MAYNIEEDGLIASIIDAKNENVYFSLYVHTENKYEKIEEYCADNIHNILDILSKYNDKKIIFAGDGAITFKQIILEQIKNAVFAKKLQNNQTSISVGKAAFDKYLQGFKGNSNSLHPLYLRKSQAERALDGEK